ncbi:MAG: putative cobaltochelatase, partial [Anaerolineae bacterium]
MKACILVVAMTINQEGRQERNSRIIPIFPFTAIVGQERMKRALILNAINPQIGGVLIRGERGTAKSTAVRALADLLPGIDVVADCPFSCDPGQLNHLCDYCLARRQRGEELAVVRRKTRMIDLPVSATEDRVVGTLDIEKAIKKGEKHFEPGVLAAANRGILYVDEVNLLDDHVVDLLLDSAAMGVNVVEREGISFSHPAQFILVGTMNPEEGELRPQLLDRFGLCVEIRSITDPSARMEILERRIQFERDPERFHAVWHEEEKRLSAEIARAQKGLRQVVYTPQDLYAIADLTAELEVDGHRSDIVILKAALAHAAFEGRQSISSVDILLAAELALPHRLKRKPFQETEIQIAQLERRLEQAKAAAREEMPLALQADDPTAGVKKNEQQHESSPETELKAGQDLLKSEHNDTSSNLRSPKTDMPVPVGKPFQPRLLQTSLDRLTRRQAGRRSSTRTSRKRGRYIFSRAAQGNVTDIAFDATLRQAAPHQIHRERNDVALAVTMEDLQQKVRVRRAANLVLFVVDASWSMAAAERMVATKGAVLSLLQDAYQKRDQVGLVTFQKEEARLILPPTSSVDLAKKALRSIPVGGKTPLSSGLLLAHEVITRERRRNPEVMPLLILLTDGAGNVSITSLPPQEEALRVASMIKQSGIRSVVINTEHEAFDRGLAQAIAQRLGGQCYTLQELSAKELYDMVTSSL